MIDLKYVLSLSRTSLIKLLLKHTTHHGEHCWLAYRNASYPTIVSHIDVVYDWYKEKGNKIILTDGNYYWSPNGIGGDDRCGVYALLTLMQTDLKANYLFCDYEESGGKGASEATKIFNDLLKDTPYFIEIDRRGYKEAVFYNNEDEVKEFISIIKKHFNISIGTFSDISTLTSHFDVCGVNLSAGYHNEHNKHSEYVVKKHLEYTIKKVPILIEELGLKRYKLPELKGWDRYNWDWYRRYYSDNDKTYLYINEDYEKTQTINEIQMLLKDNGLDQLKIESGYVTKKHLIVIDDGIKLKYKLKNLDYDTLQQIYDEMLDAIWKI